VRSFVEHADKIDCSPPTHRKPLSSTHS
jgi:hypothetical protein